MVLVLVLRRVEALRHKEWNQHKFQTFTIRLFALGDPQWRTTIQWLTRDQLKPVVLILSVVQVPSKTKEYV